MHLLAVDVGLRAGLALYGPDGLVRFARSTNFGARERLKRGAYALMRDTHREHGLGAVYLEGGGRLAAIWTKQARDLGLFVRAVHAEDWREDLLPLRCLGDAAAAKACADRLARAVIRASGLPAPTSLRHDAAEAVCLGLWAVLREGWLREPLVDPAGIC
jgi:hypothetical protein